MTTLLDNEVSIRQVGRIEWPLGVEQRSPWMEPRRLEQFELWFIWGGHGWVEQGGERWTLQEGATFWFRPWETYTVKQDPKQPLGINYVGFDLLRNGEALKEAPDGWPILCDDAEADFIETSTRRIVELYWQCYVDYKDSTEADKLASHPYFKFIDDENEQVLFAPLPISIFSPAERNGQGSIEAADAIFSALLLELLHHCRRSQQNRTGNLEKYQRRLISRIAMRIQHNPAEKLSTAKLAEECGYCSDHFAKTFKKVMHCSPQRFQMLVRIKRACHLLRESDLLIKQIALQLGYSNEYFFSRQFKSITGKTPSEFQKHR